MHREDDGNSLGDCLELLEHLGKKRSVYEGWAMQRDEHESSCTEPELLGDPKRAKPRLEAAERVDHRVPDEVDALGLDSLPTKVLHRVLRVGEQMVGELVRDDPVHLLGHRAIEAPQAGLDVPVGDTELDEHERRSQRRVDVTRDERDVRRFGGDDRLEPFHDPSRLFRVRGRPDLEPVRRLRKAELIDEDLGELRGVVLTRVNDDVVGVWTPPLELRDDRGHLDEVRPRPDNVEKSLLGHLGSGSVSSA
jgi:hypothetical protein